MRTCWRHFIIGALAIVVLVTVAVAAGLQAQNTTVDSSAASPGTGSAALFRTYCATCHEGPGANPQAPALDVMRRMTAEQVLDRSRAARCEHGRRSGAARSAGRWPNMCREDL